MHERGQRPCLEMANVDYMRNQEAAPGTVYCALG
jgi:hypothetical protein